MTGNPVAPASIIDLAGFPVSVDEDGGLKFGPGVVSPHPSLRKLEDASAVLLYPGEEGPATLYAMYRGTGLEKDRWAMESAGIRYDITVIFPGTIGSEYVKTVGHYHPKVPGQPWTYPEVYQVLKGRAHFLLQRGGEISGEVEDFMVADFSAGDILLIPPYYGHVTTNPGSEPLVLANWIASEFQAVYDPVRLRKGLAFYDVEYKDESLFMPNESYGSHPKPRLWSQSDYPELGLRRGKSMYRAWQDGADLSFLRKPALRSDLWESLGVRPKD